MTVIVGARCIDGIVVGADSISTSAAGNQSLIQIRSDDKVKIIGGDTIVAGTGSVGLSQRFNAVVEQIRTQGHFGQSCVVCSKIISAGAVQDFQSTGAPRTPQYGFGFGAVVAAPMGGLCELVEFGAQDMQPERKTSRLHFVSMGSGQLLADPFLAFISRVLWRQQEPTVQLATLGVYWALSHAIQYAPGGVGEPIQLATLKLMNGQWRAQLLLEEELGEIQQHIGEIEDRIGQYPGQVIAQAQAVPPPPPPV